MLMIQLLDILLTWNEEVLRSWEIDIVLLEHINRTIPSTISLPEVLSSPTVAANSSMSSMVASLMMRVCTVPSSMISYLSDGLIGFPFLSHLTGDPGLVTSQRKTARSPWRTSTFFSGSLNLTFSSTEIEEKFAQIVFFTSCATAK